MRYFRVTGKKFEMEIEASDEREAEKIFREATANRRADDVMDIVEVGTVTGRTN